jgi:hypothetical protein
MRIPAINRNAELLFGWGLWPRRSPGLRSCQCDALADDNLPIGRSVFRSRAFTLIDGLIIMAVLLVLMSLLLSYWQADRIPSRQTRCLMNLKQVGLAFRQWQPRDTDLVPMRAPVKHGGTLELVETGPAAIHFQALSNQLATPAMLVCPADPARTPAPDFRSGLSNSNVSYFVGLDAWENSPNSFLAGDRNLEVDRVAVASGIVMVSANTVLGWTRGLHYTRGNILLADGSQQTLQTSGLQEAARNSGLATNRLAMP